MNYKDELIRVYDEVMLEILVGEELDEEDKLSFDLAREVMIASLLKDIPSVKDEQFVIDNIALYKRIMKAMFIQDEKELRMALLEMLKIKNAMKQIE